MAALPSALPPALQILSFRSDCSWTGLFHLGRAFRGVVLVGGAGQPLGWWDIERHLQIPWGAVEHDPSLVAGGTRDHGQPRGLPTRMGTGEVWGSDAAGAGGLMRTFRLVRLKDVSGVSGTGVVASGVQFDDGWAALHWHSVHRSVEAWVSVEDLIAIHGHAGLTIIAWDDEGPLRVEEAEAAVKAIWRRVGH